MIKNVFFKFLPLISATSIIAVPLASCAKGAKTNNINDNPNLGQDNGNLISRPFIKGKIEPEIEKASKSKKNITSINVSKDNAGDVYKSINEVLTNDIKTDEELKKINKDNLTLDIYSYLYWLYLSNKSYFSFYFNKTPSITINENEKVSVSVSLKIINENHKPENLVINNNSYELNENEYIFLNINIKDLKPNLTINKYNNRFFLGLQFPSVDFLISKNNDVNVKEEDKQKDDKIVLNNFSFTFGTYSNIFLTEYENVISTLDYNSAIKDSQVIDNYNKLTNDTLGKEISEQINNVQNHIQKIVTLISNIVDSISKDETVAQFVESSSNSIVDLLIEAKVLPDNKVLIDAIKKLLNTKEPILDIIGNNKQLVVSVITQFIGNDFFVDNLISAFVNKIKPSMSKEEKSDLKKQFQDLIKTLGIKNIEYLNTIIDSLFNGDSINKLLKTILKDQTVINMISKVVGEKYKGIIELIQKVFADQNNSKPVLQIIIENKESITTILSTLINDQTLSGILKVLITENTNLSYDNAKKIFVTTIKPIADLFLKDTTRKGEQTKIEYKKETKTLTYSYKYTYTFNKDLDIDLTTLKNIVPDTIDLQKMGINTKEIEDMVANNKSNFNKYIILNTNPGKEWYKFKKSDIIKQLPDKVTIKKNDKLVFDYNVTNQNLWLNPTKIDDDKWVFGYQIPYVADIYLDAPGLFKSISDSFNNKTLNSSGASIWSNVASKYVQMLAKVYNFTGMLYISENQNILKDFDYSDRLYMKDYTFSFSEKKISKENFDKAVNSFKNTDAGSYNDLTSKITRYKTEVTNQNDLNKILIKDYSNLNLVKQNLLFTYSQMTTIKPEKDSNNQDINALHFWLPLNVRQGALWYSDEVLDLYINVNINNFASTSFLPFKILDENNNSVNSFTTSAFSIDITASSVITFLFIKFPVSFPIINSYKN
ncbi:P116 family lipid acquisition surface protein [Malacoplasma iowae]|uniref:P116 family lipid acquisition surface protein n=1 Tax=Malacoplasma iowae TaxID=2116 RepID=UPI002A187C87|nr:hypothetical protein [Malacoplasma iowae]WPL37993.1 hypothetical protein QX182_00495 [Malacoplasma iowae]